MTAVLDFEGAQITLEQLPSFQCDALIDMFGQEETLDDVECERCAAPAMWTPCEIGGVICGSSDPTTEDHPEDGPVYSIEDGAATENGAATEKSERSTKRARVGSSDPPRADAHERYVEIAADGDCGFAAVALALRMAPRADDARAPPRGARG